MKIRVLVADDSALARSMLREILEGDPGIEVVGEARDGFEAVELARSLSPDLVTMDLRMPVLDGIGAITEIMATKPLPILVVSGAADAGEAYLAVQRGALETLAKPDYSERAREELVEKVKSLAGVGVLTHLKPGQFARAARTGGGESTGGGAGAYGSALPSRASAAAGPVFAIAASTGGPQAIGKILASLPPDFPGTILIAQHISDGFAPGLAQWLSTVSRLPVSLARAGQPPLPGRAYVSPSERNLALSAARLLELREPAERQIFHPVCDVLLASVGEACGSDAVGIILTGMSEDGVRGLEMIKRAGGRTLAQDEASSIVFGMNRMAIERGATESVLPLDDIALEMCRLAARTDRRS